MFFKNLIYRLYVGLKYLLSFRHQTWRLSDYPIRYRYTPEDAVPPRPDLIRIPWSASIHGWFMVGNGDTRAEALASLRQNFDQYVESGYLLPRPGTILPLPRIADAEISKYVYLWDDFLEHILEIEPGNYAISDGSSLSDFIFSDRDRAEQNRLVALRYGVNIADIEDGNLARIFARIHAHKSGIPDRGGHPAQPE